MKLTWFLFALLAMVPFSSAWAQSPEDSLDKELLEDLAPDLSEPVKKPPADDDDKKKDAAQADGGLDRSVGEDIGQRQEDPLMGIGDSMRRVAKMLAAKNSTSATTQAQTQIVRDLERLINQARRPNPTNAPSPAQAGNSQRSKVNQPGTESKTGRSNPNAANNKPAADSARDLRPNRTAEVDMAEMRELMKDMWGHLPQRAREQMLQNSVERFLPKYELLLEKYFRRLAEERDESTP